MIPARRKHRVRPLSEGRHPEPGYWNAAVPSICVVPLQQHHGSRVHPVVAVGDTVREGTVIGTGTGRFSSLVHAPIPGKVLQIGEIPMPDERSSVAVSIELAGEFDCLGKVPAAHPWNELEQEEILRLIEEGGVVATGRGLLPLHTLLRRRHRENRARIVLDVAQSEPYVHSELEAAIASPHKTVEAIEILRVALGAERAVIAVNSARRRRTRQLRREAAARGIATVRVAPAYPADLDYQLANAAFGERLPARSLAIDRGIHIINATTAIAVHDAVVFRTPQIDRVVTVAGDAIVRPATVKARVGTSVGDLIDECGGLSSRPARIVMGGSLTGREVTNINAPITKGTASILALSDSEIHRAPALPCVGCGACLRSCPVSLDPVFLVRLIQAGAAGQAVRAGIDSCIECGLCSHVCPSRVPLTEAIRAARAERNRSAS